MSRLAGPAVGWSTVARRTPAVALLVGVGLALGTGAPLRAQASEDLVRAYLWPSSQAEFEQAAAAVAADQSLGGVTRMQMHDLEELMRRGPLGGNPGSSPGAGEIGARPDSLSHFVVAAPGGREIPVYVRLPRGYSDARQWPLMFAMHGGPPGNIEQADRSARSMVRVWTEAADDAGWIIASPVMISTISRDGRTRDRLPYEIFHPEEARAVIDAVRRRVRVDPDRIVSTGISLGSNFSIQYGAAYPDWFSAIVPVSTEGDSRELLLRNLMPVPVYILEGSQDQNIRGVGGPRALAEILTSWGYDLTYREFGDRAHEGFQEHYADVLRWLDSRPRTWARHEVLRVPHEAIMPVSRRIDWLETDTRQALLRARVTSPTHIDVTARWAGRLTLYLSDALLDLDRPISVHVNGEPVFAGTVARSERTALAEARKLGDERRIYAARITVQVPITEASVAEGAALWKNMEPRFPAGQLSFWEMYAARALEERFPSVGFEGDEVPLPESVDAVAPEQVATRVSRVATGSPAANAGLEAGDVLLTVDGEPFFRDHGSIARLHSWLMRELREQPVEIPLVVWRGGEQMTLTARYALGPYRP